MEKMNKDTILSVEVLQVKFTLRGAVLNVLRGISLDIHKGESIAIVGESGSGKSVFTKTFLGMLDSNGYIDNGTIRFRMDDSGSDESIVDLSRFKTEKEWLTVRGKQIAMVMQDPMTSLNPLKTIGRQLEETVMLHHDVTKAQAHERAVQLLTDVGINEPERRCKQYPHEFSGGMRQRVVIAIALACDPRVLICDEPTTALDVTIQAQILDLMNQLKKETGTSILFITHDLGVVAEVCDDVAVMYCGRVVERGDVKTIFSNPSHPYTKGLLGSIPRLGDAGKELKSIPGNVPNPKYMPKGCKFAPRCPYPSKKCREAEPGFFQIGEGHISRCWLCESGQLKTDHVEKAGD